MSKPIITRVTIIRNTHSFGKAPTYKGIVMHGAKMVAATEILRDRAACIAIAQTLEATYKVQQRAK